MPLSSGARRAFTDLVSTVISTGIGMTHLFLHWPFYTAARARSRRT